MSLTDAERAEIRVEAEDLLSASGQISRFASTSDGAGGILETWTNLGSPVACRLAPLGSSPAGQTADRLDERTDNVVTLPAGTDITTDDRIEIEGRTYAVTAVRRRSDDETFVLRVEAMEVT